MTDSPSSTVQSDAAASQPMPNSRADEQTMHPTSQSFFLKRWLYRGSRVWPVLRTRIRWGGRLHSLGPRTIMGRCMMITNPRSVAIGSHVTICPDFILADLDPGCRDNPKIVIGDGTNILFRFQCNAARSVVIGQNVLFASNVLVTDSDHVVRPGGVPVTRNAELVTRPVKIEDNCWIGQNAVILKGVTVGHDSIIGANSVVTCDVPPCSVAVGNPARVVKSLQAGDPEAWSPLPTVDSASGGRAWKP